VAFMLGSFTSGLFGGAHSAFQLVDEWSTLKQQQSMRQAADTVRGALDTPSTDSGALPAITDRSASVAARPSPDQASIESMPLPEFMNPKPVKASRRAAVQATASDTSSFQRGTRENMPALGTQAPPTYLPAGITPGQPFAYAPLPSALPTAQPQAVTPRPQDQGASAALPPPAAFAAIPPRPMPTGYAGVQGMSGTPSGPAVVQPTPYDQGASAAIPSATPAAASTTPLTDLGQSILRALTGG
jgi:hypothetical protein